VEESRSSQTVGTAEPLVDDGLLLGRFIWPLQSQSRYSHFLPYLHKLNKKKRTALVLTETNQDNWGTQFFTETVLSYQLYLASVRQRLAL